MFKITIDRFRNYVEVKLAGFITVEEVGQLRSQLAGELVANEMRPGAFLQLYDTTEFAIQTREVMTAFGDFNDDPRLIPQRVAFWTGLSVHRMQARKAPVACPTELFESREKALAWLFEAEARGSAAA
jgi:hypothetical protein